MKTVLLILGCITSLYSFCQDSSRFKAPLEGEVFLQYDFPESYGISATAIIPITHVQRNKTYRNSSDYHFWISGLETGWMHYPMNSSAVYANASIGVRISKYPRHYHEWMIEQGIFRTFYQGVVYSVASDGNIKELPGFGRTYATTGLTYLQNWNLNYSDHPFSLIIKPSIWIQYPFNGLIKLHTSLQIGARFFLFNNKKFSHAS